MTNDKRRGPYAKSAARRAEIIKHATEAFMQRGYQATSLREIAAAVGISQPGLTHHFNTKEELLIAVLAEKDRSYIMEIAEEAPDTIVPRLREIVERNSARSELIRLYTVLTGESINSEHPAHDFFKQRYERARRLFAELVREAQDKDEMDPNLDPGRTATLLVAVMEGLQVQWQMDERVDMVDAFDAFLDRLAPPRRRKAKPSR